MSEQMKRKSNVVINMILNTLKGFAGVVVPLIIFPYITRVLGVENIGKYNFAYSFVSYFILLAGLGIGTYAIREGAGLRNNHKRFEKFINEVFSINLIVMIFAFTSLYIISLCIPQLAQYRLIIVILGVQVFFRPFSTDWIFSVFEDYTYITVVTIIWNVILLCGVFIFVRDGNDLVKYTIIVTVASIGQVIMFYVHSGHYFRPHFKWNMMIGKHMKPITTLFAFSIAVTIYVSSDVMILGILCGDKTVGLYTVSSKIYSVAKILLSSMLTVSIPKLSCFFEEGQKKQFNKMADKLYKVLITLVFPCVAGVIILKEQIIFLIAGREYLEADTSLELLAIAIFFALAAGYWSQCILIPVKKEGYVLGITILSAVINIILNLILIPSGRENAAAFTTVISELVAFIGCWKEGKKYVEVGRYREIIIKALMGCIAIVMVAVLINRMTNSNIGYTIGTIFSSILVYSIVELLLKNEVFISGYYLIKKRMERGSV